ETEMPRATTQRRDGKGSRQRAPSPRRTSKEAPEAPIAEDPSRTPAVTKLYPTKNDLPEAPRTEVITLLNQRLADGIDLQTQCKQAHWNVKGPAFIALHKLFEKITEDAEDYVDLIAERIVKLAGVADGTAGVGGNQATAA